MSYEGIHFFVVVVVVVKNVSANLVCLIEGVEQYYYLDKPIRFMFQ